MSFRETMLLRTMMLDLLLFVLLTEDLNTVSVERIPSSNTDSLRVTLPECDSYESFKKWLLEYPHGDTVVGFLEDETRGFPVRLGDSGNSITFTFELTAEGPGKLGNDPADDPPADSNRRAEVGWLRELTQPLIEGLLSNDRRTPSSNPFERGGVDRAGKDTTSRKAGFDPLTHLPGKSYFYHQVGELVEREGEESIRFGVVVLDLDNFSRINASFNYRRGDQLLDQLGRRFRERLGEEMVVCRWGSDVFAFLVPDLHTREEGEQYLERIQNTLEEPFSIGERELYLKGSLGAALYPVDGNHATELVTMADQAMNEAKEETGNSYRFYTSGEVESAREQLMLSTDLHQAFEREQFELFYQPLVNLNSFEVEGAEALLRWRHPERGLLSPDAFLGALEDTGLILFVGKWVLETALAQLRAWEQQGLGVDSIQINASPRQFRDPSLVQNLETALGQNEIDPSRVKIEITEHVMMSDLEHSKVVLNALTELGIGVALDDFGTGHSSFGYLAELPLDGIKIDRSFLTPFEVGSKNLKLMEIMALAAQRLGLNSVAEGVETEGQFEYVRGKGIDLAQGNFVASPLPSEEFCTYCEDHPGEFRLLLH